MSANDPIIVDDPRLTAWAIGANDALTADEVAAIEAAVARDPAIAAKVADIRALDGALAAAFRAAPVAGLSHGQRAAILSGPQHKRRAWIIGGAVALAAAAALTAVALSGPSTPPASEPIAEATHVPSAPSEPIGAQSEAVKPVEQPMAAVVSTSPAKAGGSSTATPTVSANEDPDAPRYRGNVHTVAQTEPPTTPAENGGPKVRPDGGEAAALHNDVVSGLGRVAGGGEPSLAGLEGDTGRTRASAELAGAFRGVGGGYVVIDGNYYWQSYDQPNTVVVVPQYIDNRGVRDRYLPAVPWPFRLTAQEPLSTFSIDVDTASLSHARRYLRAGRAVPPNLVRVEEIVNAFHYDDPRPDGDVPIAVNVAVAESPWQPANRLVRVALTARPVENGDRAPANLVFLVDVSGSMQAKKKLPLLVEALRRLLDGLGPDDKVAIVTYASKANVALEPTLASDKETILKALGKLRAGGYTNGGAGLDVAYDLARKGGSGSNSRVILATDGDFNTGRTDNYELQRVIRDKARSGVMLSVLGFGETGYDDRRLEGLAKHGNGRYAFIDSVEEAERVLVKELDATLVTAAKDVRLQVELNPSRALAYRLVGYENRAMAAAEFNQEGKDAGELGAGESVVAFYEIMPTPGSPAAGVDALKYQGGGTNPEPAPEADALSQELMTVKVRWVPVSGGESQRLDVPVVDKGERMANASPDFVFSAAAAAFGLKLQAYGDPSGLISWGLVKDLVDQAPSFPDRERLRELVVAAEKVYGGP